MAKFLTEKVKLPCLQRRTKAASIAPAPAKKYRYSSRGLSVSQALSTPQYWLLWSMIITCATAGLNTATVYKQFAATSTTLTGDQFQTLVGGVGALFNGLGRLFWGSVLDKIGFKNAFTVLSVLQAGSMLTYFHSTDSKVSRCYDIFLNVNAAKSATKWLTSLSCVSNANAQDFCSTIMNFAPYLLTVHMYFICIFALQMQTKFALNTCMLFFTLAGNFALFPPAVQRIFGPEAGTVIYGLIYSAFALASVAGGFLTKMLVVSLGWEKVFQVMAAMSLLATALATLVTPVAEFEKSVV